jgi:hypothetical protein
MNFFKYGKIPQKNVIVSIYKQYSLLSLQNKTVQKACLVDHCVKNNWQSTLGNLAGH